LLYIQLYPTISDYTPNILSYPTVSHHIIETGYSKDALLHGGEGCGLWIYSACGAYSLLRLVHVNKIVHYFHIHKMYSARCRVICSLLFTMFLYMHTARSSSRHTYTECCYIISRHTTSTHTNTTNTAHNSNTWRQTWQHHQHTAPAAHGKRNMATHMDMATQRQHSRRTHNSLSIFCRSRGRAAPHAPWHAHVDTGGWY